MSMELSDDELLLNFSYLTSIYYNFVVISDENFKEVNLNLKEQYINNEFEKLNQDNLLNFIEYKSFLQRNDEQDKKYKLEFIKSTFKLIIMKMKKKNYFLS